MFHMSENALRASKRTGNIAIARAPWAALALVATLTGCAEISARRQVKEGNQLYTEGKYELAIKRFEGALQQAPQLEIAHHNAGLAHLKLFETGDPGPVTKEHARQATAHFLSYLKVEPDDHKIVSAMIKVYLDSEDYEGAIAFWKRRLDANPKDLAALSELGAINEKALRFDDALAWHRRRIDVAVSTEDKLNALGAIGNLQFRRALQDKELFGPDRIRIVDEGIAAYQQAIRLQPENEQLQSMLDVLYQQRALASDLSWARAIESTSALIHRLRWRDIHIKKQEQEQQEQKEAGAESAGATHGG
jgi:tetratricopeptide (TPR) repeat protein